MFRIFTHGEPEHFGLFPLFGVSVTGALCLWVSRAAVCSSQFALLLLQR